MNEWYLFVFFLGGGLVCVEGICENVCRAFYVYVSENMVTVRGHWFF